MTLTKSFIKTRKVLEILIFFFELVSTVTHPKVGDHAVKVKSDIGK